MSSKMKYIVVVPDGMADDPVEILGNKTPLEVARRTNMDYLAQHGMTGLVQTIPDGMSPGSDIGNLSIMGYDPRKYFFGRAPLEAANLNIILKDDEVAFRCNLVTVSNNQMADYSAGHISTKEAGLLIDGLNKKLGSAKFKFYPGKSYRHLLVVRFNAIPELLKIKCTPPHDIAGRDIKNYLPQGALAQEILDLMESSKEIFLNHPVNQVRIDLKENPATMIWLWGQGTRPHLPLFLEKFGLQGSIISAVDLVNGIGRLAGLEVVQVPGATGYYDTNYLGKAEYAFHALKKKDFVYVHIEAPDEAGHNGDIKMKISAIEKIDREIIGPLLKHCAKKENFRIVVLPDHATPVEKRCHVSGPVGFVMFGRGIVPDGSSEYTETAAKERGLKFKNGEELMEFFIRGNLQK
ncbi:MAG TPA: cofactor-independent phosphoglycerate mutase [Candidatus Omnitrophota bacterium]|nr:cofactor-independent phosphoglycerate mutase [Candidatus Omnitrophota bacterium]